MKKSFLRPLLALVLSLSVGIPSADAVTQQTAGHVFDGSRPYLYVEAESYSALADADNNGWKVVSKETPIVSPSGACAHTPCARP